jgi:hypothetical protein
MNPHHEHEFEAAPGLPEPLPAGERILWQGAPDWRALAVHAFHLRQLAIYFGLMLLLQAMYLSDQGAGVMLRSLMASGLMALTALGLLALTAWLSARTTLYTLTSRRVVMRIGIVLTITLNLPLRQLRSADLLARKGGLGDLSLALAGKERIGWLHLWPHARPWHLGDPKPSLRCIPQAQAVGERLMAAWQLAQSSAPVAATPHTRPASLEPTRPQTAGFGTGAAADDRAGGHARNPEGIVTA